MKRKKNLALIGGRAAGKTTISKCILCRKKQFTLFQLDQLIQYEANAKSIPQIIEQIGWTGFRELEELVVKKISSFRENILIDTGGGVVVELDQNKNEIFSHTKVQALRKHCKIVYLKRDPEIIVDLIKADPNRPTLFSKISFQTLMTRREPWYQAAADLTILCDNMTKEAITERILTWFYC